MKKRGRVLALLLVATLAFGNMSGMVMAHEKLKPADGATKEQPFWPGTGESDKFRIPCLVSLDDGTLVAGCDARWTTHMDGGGLDTIVSYSKDRGDNWNYTFANYLGDNGNAWNNESTAFIDPAMATDGKRVYMIADLYPAGYALNGAKHSPVAGKSHDEDGNILLADSRQWKNVWGEERTNASNYTYHLEKNIKKEVESAYLIKDSNGNNVEGYTVDAHFNVRGEGVEANLFEVDSPFQVWPVDYLYLTASEDGGKTWSEPSIINMRKDAEQSLLVGPGRGMVTSTGRIVFTAYEFTGGDKNSTVIYSDDQGETWKRGQSVSGWSSEAVVTEADGKLYMFTRHGGYYVSDNFGETWSEKKEMGITYNLNCQLTAITYPEKIDGKTAILFATPSNTGSRSAGKIFVGLVQDDGTLRWEYEYSINGSAYYAYSCLTILPDGTVGLLYESGDTQLTYRNLSIDEIAKGGAIGNIWCTDDNGESVSEVVMKSNENKTFVINGLKETTNLKVISDNEKVVKAEYINGKVKLTSQKIEGLERATVTLESGGATTKIKVTVTDSEKYEIVDLKIGEKKTYTDTTGNYSDSKLEGLDATIAKVELKGEDAQAIKPQMQVQTATSVANFNGATKPLTDCLFTFDKQDGEDGMYVISSTTEDGQKVYLTPKTASSAKTPLTDKSGKVLVTETNQKAFNFNQSGNGGTGGYLFFWKDDKNKLHFDRNGSIDANGRCDFEIYRQSSNSAGSEIKGCEKVTKLADIIDQEKYLIAVKANDNNYYLLNPSKGSEAYNYVAKVTNKMGEEGSTAAKTEVTISGKAEGKTSVTVGDITYYINVQNDVKEVALKVGETYHVPGKIIKEEGDKNSFTKEVRNDMPPYKAIEKIEEGTYVFGNETHIMLHSQSTVSGEPKGLGMAAANFNTGKYAESAWSIKKADNGYTMQAADGTYVNITGQNVELKETPQILMMQERPDGGVSVSCDNMYLNNWANSNNKVAAYNQDNNRWYFYRASEGNIVTAKAPGNLTLITEGTTYRLTVAGTPEACEHEFGEWVVVKEATATEEGLRERVCIRCGEKETEAIQAIGNTEGKEDSERDENGKKTENQPVKTGDTSSSVMLMLGMTGCLGVAIESMRRRLQK